MHPNTEAAVRWSIDDRAVKKAREIIEEGKA
jgi:hypothetical protein